MRLQLALVFAAAGILAGCATSPQQSDSQKTAGQAGNIPPGPATAAAPAYNPDDLLGRIRAGFRLPDLNTPLVHNHELWYERRPAYVHRMMARSARYLYYIAGEVEKRHMPSEIALLPMIESAYNPVAYSHSNASGIWQFVPATGRDYGLRQNHWVDNRRNIKQATTAALNYLSRLYQDFGDWDLAIAAYNCGEGLVSRTIARQRAAGKPTDYLSLPLPDETRNYVPKLMAVKHIIENPAAFGLTLDPIPNTPYFREVKVKKHLPIQDAARLAGMSVTDFLALNPSFKKSVIPADLGHLLLPVQNADQFEQSVASYESPLRGWVYYKAHRGEKIADIARRSGISVAYLEQVNHLHNRYRLAEEQNLLTPPALMAPQSGTTMLALGPTPDAPLLPATAPAASSRLAAAQPAARLAPEAEVHPDPLMALAEAHEAHEAAHHPRVMVAMIHPQREPEAPHAPKAETHAVTRLAQKEHSVPAATRFAKKERSAAVVTRLAEKERSAPVVARLAEKARSAPEATHLALNDTPRADALPSRETHTAAKHPARMAEKTAAPEEKKPAHTLLADNDASTVTPRFYHVKFGDTIYNIARRLAVTPEEVRLWNKLNSNHIYLGQRLAVKGGDLHALYQPEVAAAHRPTTEMVALRETPHKMMASVTSYTVRLGDTLHSIARRFHVQVADLLRWNTHGTMMALRPGDKVKIHLAQK